MKGWDGKVARVTGAGGGIGLATALAFARAGASVVMADNDVTLLEGAADGARSESRRILAVACDVADQAQVRTMVDRTPAAFNNAGVKRVGAPVLEKEDDEFDHIVDVKLRGVWNCMKAELRPPMERAGGAIVNCSSIGGLRGSKGCAAFSASKFAIITKSPPP